MTPTSADRFLALHANALVLKWQWLFAGTMLRACTADQCATISRSEADDLVAAGKMTWGVGYSMRPTAGEVADAAF